MGIWGRGASAALRVVSAVACDWWGGVGVEEGEVVS